MRLSLAPTLCSCRVSASGEVTEGQLVTGCRHTGPSSEIWKARKSPREGKGLLIGCRSDGLQVTKKPDC